MKTHRFFAWFDFRAAFHAYSGERQATFRQGEPPTSTRPTGFSIMGSMHAAPRSSTLGIDFASSDELLDRERQASALAAAGMVAESVTGPHVYRINGEVQGLPAPPRLVTSTAAPAAGAGELDNVNWSTLDLGNMTLDDMDMDFASLFDPANEIAHMQTEGSGWPLTSRPNMSPSETSSLSPNVFNGNGEEPAATSTDTLNWRDS